MRHIPRTSCGLRGHRAHAAGTKRRADGQRHRRRTLSLLILLFWHPISSPDPRPLPAPLGLLPLATNPVLPAHTAFLPRIASSRMPRMPSRIQNAQPHPHCADGDTEARGSKVTSRGHRQVSCGRAQNSLDPGEPLLEPDHRT